MPQVDETVRLEIAEGVQIREYEPGDDVPINNGFNEVFGAQRSIDEWRWKFDPQAGRSKILLAVHADGQILAHYAAIRIRAKIGDWMLDTGHVVDSFSRKVHGAGQRGVFVKLANVFLAEFGRRDRFPFLYGFPGARHVRLGKLRIGYEHLRPVVVHRRKLSFFTGMWARKPDASGFSADEIDSLWKASSHRYAASAIRESAWFAHRYDQRPNFQYTRVGRRRDGRLHCIAVVSHVGNVVRVVDLVWDGEKNEDLTAVVDMVTRLARDVGASEIQAWIATDAEASRVFERRRWRAALHPDGVHFGIHTRDPDIDADRLIDSYYYTMGDTDIA